MPSKGHHNIWQDLSKTASLPRAIYPAFSPEMHENMI